MSKESKIMTAVIAVFAGLLITVFMLGNKGGAPAASNGPVPNADQLVRSDSRKTGTGPVTVVEFGDYQCPACAQAAPITKQLLSDYEGKINLVVRHYPLPQHKNAEAAAHAAEAAGEQGKYWEMHDKLFSAQSEWENLGNPNETFAGYATALGLDGGKIKEAIEQKKYADRIAADKADANAVSIQGTPTFFVNGVMATGYDYNTLKTLIDSALAE